MDVNKSHRTHGPQAHERYREAMADLVKRTRGKVQDAREAVTDASERTDTRRAEAQSQAQRRAHAARVDAAAPEQREPKDRVEISNDLAALARTSHDGSDEIRPKVARLKHAYRVGQLNTPERMERAAENLLRAHRSVPDVASLPNDLGGPNGSSSPGPNDEDTPNGSGGANVVG